jgi:NitT/TauT family transport system substrate-binding protein
MIMHRASLLPSNALAAITSVLLAACTAGATAPPTAAPTTAPATFSPTTQPSPSPEPKWTGPLDNVTLRLDWMVVGNNAMYHLGQSKGFYAAQGIDVTIGEGKGSVSTAQIIAANGDTFGISDMMSSAVVADQGAPIAAVATFMRSTPMGIVTLASSGITKPQDLKGKRIGGAPAGAPTVLLPALLKANGMTMADIQKVNVQAAAAAQALVDGQIDGSLQVAGSQAPLIEIVMGQKVNVIEYADYGVNGLFIGLIVNKSLLSSKPDLVRRFVKASIMSWQYATEHPDEVVQTAVARGGPGTNPAVVGVQARIALAAQDTSNTKGVPPGRMVEADVNQTVQLLKDYLGLSSSFDSDAFFLNDFLPR